MNDYCEILAKSYLDVVWSEWFEGLTITHNDRGETLFYGRLRDQAAFYGLLAKVREIGLLFISIKYKVDE